MNVQVALEKFLLQLHADGRSEHTSAQVRRHVLLLGGWCRASDGTVEIEDVDHELIARFLASPTATRRADGKPKRGTSVNALRSSLRRFFDFLADAGYLDRSPARLVRMARSSSAPRRFLSESDQRRLLDVLAAGQGQEARRDEALFDLLLSTGLRIGSALGLEVEDVDICAGEMRVLRAKGDQAMALPLAEGIRGRLLPYLESVGRGPLFVGRMGRAITARHANRRLRMWLARAGVAQAVSVHALRHTFAQGAYERSGDILAVGALLGHRSIGATMTYARAGRERIRMALLA
jgi:site-specific recombinase XerC